MSPKPRRTRLSIDVSAEARRRLRLAAARSDQSIRDYVWEAVESKLHRDTAPAPPSAAPAQPDRPAAGNADPVLADLWNNAEDAIYDDL
jgi:hypothetical protein